MIPIGGPIDMTIVAANIAFAPPEAGIPAGVPLRITLNNLDVDVPHNVQLLAGPGFMTVLATTEIINGPGTTPPVTVGGLVPGNYRFTCQIHPTMIFGADGRPVPVRVSRRPDRRRDPARSWRPDPAAGRGRSALMPRSRASSRIVRPDLKASLARVAASS